MTRQYPGFYDETTLAVLDKALRDIWQTLELKDPSRDWERESLLKTVLAEKLMALAAIGVTRPEELKTKTLETLPQSLGDH